MSRTKSESRRSIAELQPGDRVEEQAFLIAQKDLRTTGNGDLYIHAVLADRTGQMLGRMWSASQSIYESMPDGGLLNVRGRVESYKGKKQFIIDGIRAVDPGSVDPTEFLPKTEHDIEKMWERVLEILRGVQNPDLRNLIARFVKDAPLVEHFKMAPAARTNHHAFLGGLLEHTLGLLELALVALPRYPRINADLVLAGLFLHDIGKTAELGYSTAFQYTNEGQLLGHIVQATIWIAQKAREIEAQTQRAFPPDLLAALQHIVVAHHGRYEFGSPKLPATPEAMMVHALDNLDAKLTMMFAAIDGDVDETSEWTAWVQPLETKVYKVDFLDR